MMYPMNNPMMSMVQMAMGGMSPMQYLQQRMGQSPQIAQAMNLIQGKTPEQLHQIADNIAKQCGTTVEEIARQYGIPINTQTPQAK